MVGCDTVVVLIADDVNTPIRIAETRVSWVGHAQGAEIKIWTDRQPKRRTFLAFLADQTKGIVARVRIVMNQSFWRARAAH